MPNRKYPFVILLLLALVWLIAKSGILIINVTPSLPRGIYLRVPSATIKNNDLVLICLTDEHKKIGLTREYIAHGTRCNGADPLLKLVVATPGDNVTLYEDHLTVNNTILPYPTLSFDSKNRPLTPYPRKAYLNTPGYWLIGTHDKRSWDSRYWGPVARQQIIGKVKPLIFWLSFQKRHY